MSSGGPTDAALRRTIRFEDLGEPVQRLLKSLKSDLSEDDMALLEYVSVKDMAKIYGEMTTDRHAQEIWEELREALQARREKVAQRASELAAKREALEAQQRAMEDEFAAQRAREEAEQAEAEEARRLRREHRKAEREAAAAEEAAAAAQAAQEAAEEAAALAEEEARQARAEKKQKRREARARELQEEQEALLAEQARRERRARERANQKDDWAEYVKSHPLEFTEACGNGHNSDDGDIAQKKIDHMLNSPPTTTRAVLSRTYTPKCPNCGSKFAQPPKHWECPLCLRQETRHILVWQPDNDSQQCMVCRAGIGRWSRHHCRNCGRLVCSSCCETRAYIPCIGFRDPVKVCDECATMQPPPSSGPSVE